MDQDHILGVICGYCVSRFAERAYAQSGRLKIVGSAGMKRLFGGWVTCLLLAGCTETITNTVTETVVDTVIVTDTIRPVSFAANITLVAEGIGSISGQLVDATMYQGVPIFAEQRGPIEDIAGNEILRVPVPTTDFGGMLGILGVGERLYISHTDSANRLMLRDDTGRILYQTDPYRIDHHGGGLALYGGRILLGYGYGESHSVSFSDEVYDWDPAHGGVVSIDPATLDVDTIAIGIRNAFKLTVWDDDLIVSSSGEFLWETLFKVPLGSSEVPDFGWPWWEGPVCHSAEGCPSRTPPWYTYQTAAFGCSAIVGGAILDDSYWFTDFCEAWVRSHDGETVLQRFDLPGRTTGLKNVGDRVFVLGYDGDKVWEITAEQP